MIGIYNESGLFQVCSESVPVCSEAWNVEKQYVPGMSKSVPMAFSHKTAFAENNAFGELSCTKATACSRERTPAAVWRLRANLAP